MTVGRAFALFIVVLAAAALWRGERVEAQASVVDSELVLYVHPVNGPVIDGFRPPDHIGDRGNRGLEYDSLAGAPVWAAADGRVRFCGNVAGRGVIVITHTDGLRSTYTGLDEMHVCGGRQVLQFDEIGTTTNNLHFGLLIGNTYLDPQVAIDASESPKVPRLVAGPS